MFRNSGFRISELWVLSVFQLRGVSVLKVPGA